MTELVSINAISRVRDGREVRYFMNPNVGTCLKGRSRDAAQAAAVQLTLADRRELPFEVVNGGGDSAA